MMSRNSNRHNAVLANLGKSNTNKNIYEPSFLKWLQNFKCNFPTFVTAILYVNNHILYSLLKIYDFVYLYYNYPCFVLDCEIAQHQHQKLNDELQLNQENVKHLESNITKLYIPDSRNMEER